MPRSQMHNPRPLERRVGLRGREKEPDCMAFLFAPYRFGAERLAPVAHHGPLILVFYQKKLNAN